MIYKEGITFIKGLFELHKISAMNNSKMTLSAGNIKIEIPGYKKNGDYKVLKLDVEENLWKAPSHVDIVKFIFDNTFVENASNVIDGLECIFINGLKCENNFLNKEFQNLLFWLTLQEDLNYPMPRFQGRKLPFQRYYEAVLAKLGHYNLELIQIRTNNHKGGRPNLLKVPENIKIPVFYSIENYFI